MQTSSCRGIILRVYPYSETSLIVHCLTDAHGLISLLAKGARRFKSSFAGKIDLFYLCRLELILSKRSDLHLLKEIILEKNHPELAHDYSLLCMAVENMRCVERLIERNTAVPEIFNLVCDYLYYLPRHDDLNFADIVFKLRLLALLGRLPGFSQLRLEKTKIDLICTALERNWSDLISLSVPETDLKFLKVFLSRQITEFHL